MEDTLDKLEERLQIIKHWWQGLRSQAEVLIALTEIMELVASEEVKVEKR